MGGSGGDGPSSINIGKLTEMANQRIQSALSERRATTFICSVGDASELQRLINQSAIRDRAYSIVTDRDRLQEELQNAGLVVFFVDRSESHAVIDMAIPLASELRKTSIFVHARGQYSVPNYVTQFRVRVMSWGQFLESIG
jgi:hypothetical protein